MPFNGKNGGFPTLLVPMMMKCVNSLHLGSSCAIGPRIPFRSGRTQRVGGRPVAARLLPRLGRAWGRRGAGAAASGCGAVTAAHCLPVRSAPPDCARASVKAAERCTTISASENPIDRIEAAASINAATASLG